MTALRAPRELHDLIAANGRFWAAEAEVFATYFASPERSAATDAVWLARQCFKEMIDGVVGRLGQLTAQAEFATTVERSEAALADEVVRVELKHYAAFAIAYRLSAGLVDGSVEASPRIGADWPENAELQALRARQRRDHGEIGERAAAFTEGGYCTLYRAGIALRGGSALDEAIADACAQVLDDEWDHMLQGIAGLAEVPLAKDQWRRLEALTVAQGRCRILMRNAQFGFPLSTGRLNELLNGASEPMAFDYARAGLLPP